MHVWYGECSSQAKLAGAFCTIKGASPALVNTTFAPSLSSASPQELSCSTMPGMMETMVSCTPMCNSLMSLASFDLPCLRPRFFGATMNLGLGSVGMAWLGFSPGGSHLVASHCRTTRRAPCITNTNSNLGLNQGQQQWSTSGQGLRVMCAGRHTAQDTHSECGIQVSVYLALTHCTASTDDPSQLTSRMFRGILLGYFQVQLSSYLITKGMVPSNDLVEGEGLCTGPNLTAKRPARLIWLKPPLLRASCLVGAIHRWQQCIMQTRI